MADESADVEHFDAHDDEVVGGGGYIDDDIDLDDDDDDDDKPLVALASQPPSQTTSSQLKQQQQKKRPKPHTTISQPPAQKKKRLADPDPRDYQLRAVSTGSVKDYVVARFIANPPQLDQDTHLRLYRENENTMDGRKAGLEAHHKQQVYFQTFAGKRRLERYKNQGIVHIMDRHKKGWKMEHAPKQVAKQLEDIRKKKIEERKKNPHLNDADNQQSTSENETPEDLTQKELESVVNTYSGVFDGKSTAPYCIMVLNQGTKTVDVVPIDNYAWFSFRANRLKPKDAEAAEAAEARFLKLSKKKEQRLGQFQAKYEDAQMEREQAMGDNTRIQNSADYASVGLRRNRNIVQKESDELIAEGMEFEMEFDNDDVAQVDRETIVKNENRVLGDAEQQAKEFRKLIKDEPKTTQPPSHGSDSEEDRSIRDGPRSRSVSPSPERSSSQSPRRSVSPSPSRAKPTQGKPPVKPKTSAIGQNRRSPSPGTRERSPTPVDVSHLLPPRGTLPNEDHVKAVLGHMLRDKTRVSFKEFLKNFERNTQAQKSNLTKILRQIAQVEADPVRSKNYFISWKRSAATRS